LLIHLHVRGQLEVDFHGCWLRLRIVRFLGSTYAYDRIIVVLSLFVGRVVLIVRHFVYGISVILTVLIILHLTLLSIVINHVQLKPTNLNRLNYGHDLGSVHLN